MGCPTERFGNRKTEMTRYYFDIKDGDDLALDEEGLELPAIKAAQVAAARSFSRLSQRNDGWG